MLYCDWLVFNSFDWCILILTVLIGCSLSSLLFHSSPAVVFLDRGIHASGISIPPSLLTLLGWSLMWITSLTLHVYQCRSRDHLGFTLRRRFVQATSPLPTTTRHTHCFQVWNYAKITLCTAKTPCDPIKQDCAVYRIPCDCGKVYISESGRPMKDRIKEHEWDIRFANTQTSTVLEQHQQG